MPSFSVLFFGLSLWLLTLSAGRVLERVGEYVAPPVKSDLEEVKGHWRSIRVFYHDQNNDVEGAQGKTKTARQRQRQRDRERKKRRR